MTPLLMPLNPQAPSSVLPSPPTSPTSPRAATARIRIKPSRRPVSLVNIIPTTHSEDHEERTRSMSPPLSTILIAEPDASSSGSKTIMPSSAIAAANKRRQSSIAYYTPSSPSPWSQQPLLNRTLSSAGDGPRDGEPVASNGKGNISQRSSLVLSSRSPSTRESLSSSDGMGTREREPLTLVEKHADLLHFIAQKERKCLELRDQLAAHEKELAELKHKWECIVNLGHDPLPNAPLTASLGGVALDGLKEGVRMIAAGFSDLSGAIQELESDNNSAPNSKPLTHRENSSSASNAGSKRTGSDHLSMSSVSSVHDSVHMHISERVLDGEGEVMATTVVTAPSLSRSGSLNHRVHKRASRAIAKEPTTPTSAVAPPPGRNSDTVHLDENMGMSLMLAPSLMLNSPPKSSATRPVSAAAAPISWMDNMGKKLSELQKGQTFSKSQKRASSLLAGVSSTINSALLPRPTATTPAPYPTPVPSLLSTTKTHAPPAQRQRQRQLHPQPDSQPHSFCKPTPDWDWLDDEEERGEEETVHANGGALVPDSKRATGVDVAPDERAREAAPAVPNATSSFEDEDWNW